MKRAIIVSNLPRLSFLLGFTLLTSLPGLAQKQTAVEPARLNWVYHWDDLEKYRDTYGSITVKQPDVWGRARLTQHQDEYEKQMADQLSRFSETLQGVRSFSEQSAFGSATSVGLAVSGSVATISNPADKTNSIAVPTNAGPSLTNLGLQNVPLLTNGAIFGSNSLHLEPTQLLEEQSAYIRHLQELRRINEGDDTADAPGYAMYLLRTPVSINPGGKTRKGYGAEITFQAAIEIQPGLVQKTFRSMVINDLVQQLAPLIGRLAADTNLLEDYKHFVEDQQKIISDLKLEAEKAGTNATVTKILQDVAKTPTLQAFSVSETDITTLQGRGFTNTIKTLKNSMSLNNSKKETTTKIEKIFKTVQSSAGSISRKSPFAFANSDLVNIYGLELIMDLATRLGAGANPLHAYDVIRDDLNGAYDYVAGFEDTRWTKFRDVPEHLRTRCFDEVHKLRPDLTICTSTNVDDSTVLKLAWPVVLETILLNQRLNEEIHSETGYCNCKHGDCRYKKEDYQFYGRDISPCAVEAFKSYVEKRWPIHVFAVDPVTEDQNVADTLSVRRQLQLAVAVAVASGKINASQAITYMKSIAKDVQTVALNRTISGFTEGDDQFGWRFYPRLQAVEKRKDSEIEPGPRECMAMIILPSFIAHVSLETRSRWFTLDEPFKTEPELGRMYVLSEYFKMFETDKGEPTNTERVFPKDQDRLKKLLKSFKAVLPLQSLNVAVPFENTLGGFALLNDGVTALGPELYGSYGNVVLQSNRFCPTYLVGNNFNIRGTHVIAGGVEITNFTLLSRQLILAQIPWEATVEGGKLSVQVATPYGVTGEEKIAAVKKEDKPKPPTGAANWENPVLYVKVNLQARNKMFPDDDDKKIVSVDLLRGAPDLSVNTTNGILSKDVHISFKFTIKSNDTTVVLTNKVAGADPEIVSVAPAVNIANVPGQPKIDFAQNVWPTIKAFLQNSLPLKSMPTVIKAETHFKLDIDAIESSAATPLEIHVEPHMD